MAMRVYISVDMEGVAGVSHPDPTGLNDPGYARNVELMLGEANAAIEGALEGGADGIVVNDSHGSMYNLPPAGLNPVASLVQGSKPFSMVEAATEGRFDVALFVGYHARAGHPTGTIAHTYTGKPTLTLLAGRPVPEAGINALYLGALGIPVGLVSGDDALAEEMEGWLPWAEKVIVKRGVSTSSAESVHPSEACARIRAGSERAVRRAGERPAKRAERAHLREVGADDADDDRAQAGTGGKAGAGASRPPELPPLKALRLPPPIEVGIDFHKAIQADWAAVIPGAWRDGDRGVRYKADDAIEAYRAFNAMMRLGSSI
jgi:D-amino peptidase